MKTLYLLRHGKSSWDFEELSDFERPLITRGRNDAFTIGKYMSKNDLYPACIITSPANRAFATARIVAEAIEYPFSMIRVSENLYEGNFEGELEVIHSLTDEIESLLLVGHNPAMYSLIGTLAKWKVEHLPTAGFVEMTIDVAQWSQVHAGSGMVQSFVHPRNMGTTKEK